MFFFSSRRRHTRCALVTGVQTCALPISIDRTAGIASHGREETARAYMDKFFSLRVPMPPHVSDDMPKFVQKLLPDDHPLRSGEHIGSQDVLESTLLVLARGHVESPRHLVHRVNGFLTEIGRAHV